MTPFYIPSFNISVCIRFVFKDKLKNPSWHELLFFYILYLTHCLFTAAALLKTLDYSVFLSPFVIKS